jgi:hypothetical protein
LIGAPASADDGVSTKRRVEDARVMSSTTQTLAPQRRFVTPLPDETVEEIAARAMPGEPVTAAVDRIKSWNLHIFAMRRPPGLLTGSDIVFVEPPRG